jgi:hypothetical protein
MGQRVSAVLTSLLAALICTSGFISGLGVLAGWIGLVHALLTGFWIEAARQRNRAGLATSVLWALGAASLAWIAGQPVPAFVFVVAPCLYALRIPEFAAFLWMAVQSGAALWMLVPSWIGAAGLAVLAATIGLNWNFYRFLGKRRGPLFAITSVPMHMFYFIYSVTGFVVGNLRHHLHLRGTAHVEKKYERLD